MNIQSTRVHNTPQKLTSQNQQTPPQQPEQPNPKDKFVSYGAGAVGALAGGFAGYHVGGTLGVYAGICLTSAESGLGDLLVNMARGGAIGAIVGTAVYGAAVGVGAYMAAEHLQK